MLTLNVFSPAKPRVEIARDFKLVVAIELVALICGVHTLSHARLIALVFEVDRFRLVSYIDFDKADAVNAPEGAQSLSWSGPRTVAIRMATTSAEKLASLDASPQGVEPAQRPSWWQDYASQTANVLGRSRASSELLAKHPTQSRRLEVAVAETITDPSDRENTDSSKLRWLPLVSRRVNDWVGSVRVRESREPDARATRLC